jgi:hypothetical protein
MVVAGGDRACQSRPIRSPQPVKTAIRPDLTAARVRGRYPARALSPPRLTVSPAAALPVCPFELIHSALS